MIGVFVEGDADKEAMEEVVSDIGISATVREISGGFNPRKINGYRDHHNYDGALVLRDTNCSPRDRRYRKLQQEGKIEELDEDSRVCFAKCELEAWLLADENALSTVLNEDIDPIPNPENLHDPKEKMQDLFRQAQGYKSGYNGPRDAPKIADAMDIEVVANKCESFQGTRETLEALG